MGSKKSAKAAAVTATATSMDTRKQDNKAQEEALLPAKIALDSDESDAESDREITELKVNAKFAKEYMDRKRKEELTKLERQRAYLEEENEDESDSETEDEDGEELTEELDNDIKKTLRLIRKRDPIIYDKSVTFFKAPEGASGSDSDGDSESGEKDKKQNKKDTTKKKTDANKPLYYKDLVRQQVIAEDMDSEEEEENSPARVMTYGEEQAKLKADFMKTLKAATGSDDDDEEEEDNGGGDEEVAEEENDLEGGLFSIRTKSTEETQQEDAEFAEFQSKYGTKLKKDKTVDPDAFLENYLNGGWKEKKNVIPHYEDIVKEDDEDAEELEKMEEFEHAYNFRFEEEGSGLIQTYSRMIDNTLRRKDESRKRKREERKERKALERQKKEEELRRLKNLKQAEIQSKLDKITKLVGKVSAEDKMQAVLMKDLEGEFDPEAYDQRMQQIFDDEYYNENDETMDEKPTWDDEEDKALFADLPVEDEDEEEQENEEEEEEIAEPMDEEDEEEEDEDEVEAGDEEEDEEDTEEEKEENYATMTPEELQRAKQKYLDELYSLDYEDLIGDIKCRFKYRSVKKNDFGLTAEEIMAADDAELKQLVSLKRLAPYVENEYSVHRKQIKSFRKSLLEKLAEEAAQTRKGKKASKKEEEDGEEEDEVLVEAPASKKRKRNKKNKQAEKAEEVTGDAPVDKAEEDKTMEEAAVAAEEEPQKAQKKQRRSGKKKKTNGEASNPFASTGLSSSRLESYKLIKTKK